MALLQVSEILYFTQMVDELGDPLNKLGSLVIIPLSNRSPLVTWFFTLVDELGDLIKQW